MAVERTQAKGDSGQAEVPTTGELVDRLSRFDGPPEQFLVNLLAVQCHLASAAGGAILRGGRQAQFDVVAVFPPLQEGVTAPVWLARAGEVAQEAADGAETAVWPLHEPEAMYGQPARVQLVMVPLRAGGGIRGLAAFIVEADREEDLADICERLELSASLLSLYEMRLSLQRRQLDMQRLRTAMETLATANSGERFAETAMAVCNETASRWQCDHVALGFLKGRYVHLKALSHTEKFSRKMKLIQDIESAMEECLDQDVEVVYPPPDETSYVCRAAEELSKRHGPTAIASMPLRRGGEVVGVLTAERPLDRPFSLDDLEVLRLTCDLCTARLVDLHEHDRWVGAKAAGAVRKGLAMLVGPKHTWLKVAAVAICAAIVFLIFAKGQYRADASFAIQADVRRVVPAPFDGHIEAVFVRPDRNKLVKAGQTVLIKLDTSHLVFQLAAEEAEKARFDTVRRAAREAGMIAEAKAADADADGIAAKIGLLEYRISKASIVSPIDGVVVIGDLERQIGAPVQTGDILVEVAQLESFRAELSVSEDQIAEINVGARGELATTSRPNVRIGFTVERINPVAEVVEQKNVFKVRVRLDGVRPWMRPGMEGLAKVSIGRRTYGWIWTRKMVNWIRMKLWL